MENLIIIDTMWDQMVRMFDIMKGTTKLHMEEETLRIQLLEERIERLEKAFEQAEEDKKKMEKEINGLSSTHSHT